ALVIADGLSALAVQRHAAPMALKIAEQCQAEGWSLGPVALVEQGRVAVADEIGQRLKARMVVILLGELRPGRSP
ncbi:ethanolamine ammonia-lyase light chain EutC, partial [Stutzerimonas stutzeri]|uniref:ethanolamine ammonia-lyase light chain EutC n=1 Tax=Stutzerimonas stutzeri TaxID=316 RepID=UPI0024B7231B